MSGKRSVYVAKMGCRSEMGHVPYGILDTSILLRDTPVTGPKDLVSGIASNPATVRDEENTRSYQVTTERDD